MLDALKFASDFSSNLIEYFSKERKFNQAVVIKYLQPYIQVKNIDYKYA